LTKLITRLGLFISRILSCSEMSYMSSP